MNLKAFVAILFIYINKMHQLKSNKIALKLVYLFLRKLAISGHHTNYGITRFLNADSNSEHQTMALPEIKNGSFKWTPWAKTQILQHTAVWSAKNKPDSKTSDQTPAKHSNKAQNGA